MAEFKIYKGNLSADIEIRLLSRELPLNDVITYMGTSVTVATGCIGSTYLRNPILGKVGKQAVNREIHCL
jgi:hypothetical protein